LFEYINAPFSISDGIYGSIFFVATGFHGLHVIVGTVALIVCCIRHHYYHFHVDHHVGLELSV
jgi:cytochrome c oxidase subunit 3